MMNVVKRVLGVNDKARPGRAELVKVIDQILWDCKCDVDGHMIRIRLNGYVYSIKRELDERKTRS